MIWRSYENELCKDRALNEAGVRRGARLIRKAEDIVKLDAEDGVGYHKDQSSGDVQDSILRVEDRHCRGKDSNCEWSRRGMQMS